MGSPKGASAPIEFLLASLVVTDKWQGGVLTLSKPAPLFSQWRMLYSIRRLSRWRTYWLLIPVQGLLDIKVSAIETMLAVVGSSISAIETTLSPIHLAPSEQE